MPVELGGRRGPLFLSRNHGQEARFEDLIARAPLNSLRIMAAPAMPTITPELAGQMVDKASSTSFLGA